MNSSHPSRRQFLASSAAVTTGFLGMRRLFGSGAGASPGVLDPGELVNLEDAPLALPKGFRARLVATQGEEMDDGLLRPGKPDGMAAFAGKNPDEVVLVCNHEVSFAQTEHGAFGPKNERFAGRPPSAVVAHTLPDGRPLLGGTTTIRWNAKTGKTHQHLSLGGTERNCAGGPTPWGSWITCEEPERLVGPADFFQKFGWCFEVPAHGRGNPEPIRGMGRMRHEATAIDPRTGIVYLTEDRADGLFYRFRPDRPGDLHAGGVLEALVFRDRTQADTRNWDARAKGGTIPVGRDIAVDWLPLDEVESPRDDLRHRGFAQGAAVFARGEGIWFGNGEVYFACTNGGPRKLGQIYRYTPSQAEGTDGEAKSPGQLDLFLQPSDRKLLEGADNLCVAPWGDVVICEDGGGEQFLRGVSPEGRLYTLAKNTGGLGEFAGACFAPDKPILFVNLQKPGLTYAIEGPWPEV